MSFLISLFGEQIVNHIYKHRTPPKLSLIYSGCLENGIIDIHPMYTFVHLFKILKKDNVNLIMMHTQLIAIETVKNHENKRFI